MQRTDFGAGSSITALRQHYGNTHYGALRGHDVTVSEA
jgi:hypothetical protein